MLTRESTLRRGLFPIKRDPEANIVASEVLHEVTSDEEFAFRLGFALGNHSLDKSREKGKDLRFMKHFCCFPHHFPIEQVSLRLLEWVVES